MSGLILKWLAHSWNRLFASKRLLPYERLVFDAWRATLPREVLSILDAQLEAVAIVQRQAGGAKMCFYYEEGRSIPLFKLKQPDLHAATVILQAEGVENMRVRIFLHRGRFFSIEFPKRPNRYLLQHHLQKQALHVARVVNHVAIA